MKATYSILFAFIIGLGMISCSNDKPSNNNTQPKKKNTSKVDHSKPESTKKVSQQAKSKIAVTPKEIEVKENQVPKEQLKKAAELIAAVDNSDVEAVNAKTKYKMFCSTCHGFKGDMSINGSKKLVEAKTNLTESVAQIYFGKGTMTPFKGLLKDEEIIAVAKYIETLRK